MNNKKAIKILKEQLKKIENPELRTDSFLIELKTYIKVFFSEKSDQYLFISNFTWYKHVSGIIIQNESKLESDKYNKLKTIITDCINTIKNIGIKKEPIDNWFSKLPNWVINLGLPALCFVSFGIGILFTTNNNSELRKENTKLKDKLLLISSDTITNQNKNLSDNPKT